MCYVSKAAFLFLFVLGACLTIGCSEENTAPDNNPPPSVEMKHIWSKCFGDATYQTAAAVAVDASRNVILMGRFAGTVDFGGGALTSAGNQDIFVAKFGSDGAHLWSKSFDAGSLSYNEAFAIAVDASGNVIVAGYFAGTVNFGGGTLTSAGDHDIFVSKFGAGGDHLWSKSFGDANYQEATAVAVDASGNVILTGRFAGTVNFGGGALTSEGDWDIFVAKFGSDGIYLWSKRFGDAFGQQATAIAGDASGNVIVTGVFLGTVNFGGGALTSAGDWDIFVAKLGSDGAHLWSKSFGDGSSQVAHSVDVDISGNVIVAGFFWSTVNFGGSVLTSSGSCDLLVAKFGPDGTHLWSERFGDSNTQYAFGVTVDGSENVIVSGPFNGTVDFGGGALTSASNNYDIFVAILGPDGARLWSKRFGDSNMQYAEAVAVDVLGNAIVSGSFEGTVDFGGGGLTSAGTYDIFVAKFGR